MSNPNPFLNPKHYKLTTTLLTLTLIPTYNKILSVDLHSSSLAASPRYGCQVSGNKPDSLEIKETAQEKIYLLPENVVSGNLF